MSKGKIFFNAPIQSPCKKCTTRHESCHSNCGRFALYRVLLKSARELNYKKLKHAGLATYLTHVNRPE